MWSRTGEECPVLQTQEHEKIVNLMPVKKMLPKAVLELEDFRTLSCSLGGYQVSWASCAHGDTWVFGTFSAEVSGVTETA